MRVGSAAFAQYVGWGRVGVKVEGHRLTAAYAAFVGNWAFTPSSSSICRMSFSPGTGTVWGGGEGVWERLGHAWEYSQKCQVGGTTYLLPGLGSGLAWLPLPPTLLPAPTHALPSKGGAGGWKNTAFPCSSREMLAGCLP